MTRAVGLTWGIKDSLIAYIEGPAAGDVDVTAPAVRTDAGFTFPWSSDGAVPDGTVPSGQDGTVTLRFTGAVQLTGHWGALDVLVADPRVTLTGRTGTLAIRDRGHRDPAATLVIADLTLVEGGSATGAWELGATLTAHGRFLLGAQYAVGEDLAPLHIAVLAGR